MALFGLFKLMRMFRLGMMIAHSNFNIKIKSLLKLLKLIIYLMFYIHILGCYYWIAIEDGQGPRYYRDFLHDNYESYLGGDLLGPNGLPVRADDDFYMKFGPQPTFAEDAWKRYTVADTLGWKEENQKWESRSKTWYMPIYFVNYGDQELDKDSRLYGVWFRYSSMIYYGLLNIGSNEFGPVNWMEMGFLALTLIVSAMLNSIVFGEVASLVGKLSEAEAIRQSQLDKGNSVMISIEMNEEEQIIMREFLQMTQNTKETQEEQIEFYKIISPSLKIEVQNEAFQ